MTEVPSLVDIAGWSVQVNVQLELLMQCLRLLRGQALTEICNTPLHLLIEQYEDGCALTLQSGTAPVHSVHEEVTPLLITDVEGNKKHRVLDAVLREILIVREDSIESNLQNIKFVEGQ